jgi:hypothetical protein
VVVANIPFILVGYILAPLCERREPAGKQIGNLLDAQATPIAYCLASDVNVNFASFKVYLKAISVSHI